MDHLLECAEAFEQLLDVQYHIVLGRIEYLLDSNKTVFLQVLFPKRREGLHKRTSSLYITKKRNNNS